MLVALIGALLMGVGLIAFVVNLARSLGWAHPLEVALPEGWLGRPGVECPAGSRQGCVGRQRGPDAGSLGREGRGKMDPGRAPGGAPRVGPGGRVEPMDALEAVVEIPRGSRNKYEMDHATGTIRLDRVLFSSVHYPTDYGFIVGTRAADGDPLDVLIVVEEPTFPGCRVRIRPIGVLTMKDEKGMDEKILAVPVADPRFDGVRDITDLPGHWLLEIHNFFSTYKLLEGKETEVHAWEGAAEAMTLLNRYQRKGLRSRALPRRRGRGAAEGS